MSGRDPTGAQLAGCLIVGTLAVFMFVTFVIAAAIKWVIS